MGKTSFFRDLCYHLRGLGRKRHRARTKVKERRHGQGIMTAQQGAWEGDTSSSASMGTDADADPNSDGNSTRDDGIAATSEGETETQTQPEAEESAGANSSSGTPPGSNSVFSHHRHSSPSGSSNALEEIPNAPDIPWTSPLESLSTQTVSAQVTVTDAGATWNGSSSPPPPVVTSISVPAGLLTPGDVSQYAYQGQDLQATGSGSPPSPGSPAGPSSLSLNPPQPNSIEGTGDDPADAQPSWGASQQTVSDGNSTLTTMSGPRGAGEEPSDGLLSQSPSLMTPLSLGNSTGSRTTTRTTLSSTHHSSTSARAAPKTSTRTSTIHPASSSSSSDIQSLNGAPALPTMGHANGAVSTRTAQTIAGTTIASVGAILLIIAAVVVYVRRTTTRGPGSPIRFPSFRARREFPSSRPFNESEENFFRRETTQIRPFDIENATVTSGSHYSDDEESWEEIDVRDARTGNMERDNGEWLESWRRGKERMPLIGTRRPPDLLRFNPQLPLPPITLDDQRRVNPTFPML